MIASFFLFCVFFARFRLLLRGSVMSPVICFFRPIFRWRPLPVIYCCAWSNPSPFSQSVPSPVSSISLPCRVEEYSFSKIVFLARWEWVSGGVGRWVFAILLVSSLLYLACLVVRCGEFVSIWIVLDYHRSTEFVCSRILGDWSFSLSMWTVSGSCLESAPVLNLNSIYWMYSMEVVSSCPFLPPQLHPSPILQQNKLVDIGNNDNWHWFSEMQSPLPYSLMFSVWMPHRETLLGHALSRERVPTNQASQLRSISHVVESY